VRQYSLHVFNVLDRWEFEHETEIHQLRIGEYNMSIETFARTFRDEHRLVRDTLLDLIHAFQDRDRERIQDLMNKTAEYTGPHFRYEEEALYPGLVGLYGESYIESLLEDHDGAIASARRLVELAGQPELTDADVQEPSD